MSILSEITIRKSQLELGTGIIGGLHTPVRARQVAYLMGHLTAEKTSEVCTELGISGPSSPALREQEGVEASASSSRSWPCGLA